MSIFGPRRKLSTVKFLAFHSDSNGLGVGSECAVKLSMRILSSFTVKILIILHLSVAVWAAPEQVGLHLSFEQRLAVSYALLAHGEPAEVQEQILERAQKYMTEVATQGITKVQVRNFSEFMDQFKGDWPNTNKLSKDIELIESRPRSSLKVFESQSPRVQRQIDGYLQWQEQEFLKRARRILKTDKLSNIAVGLSAGVVSRKALLQIGDQFIAESFSLLDQIGPKIAESNLGQQQDPLMKIFMGTMLSEYFSRLSLDSKKMIASSFLGSDLYMDDFKKFEVMVQNSGPQLQKLLQIVARQADLGSELLTIFRSLENAVRPVPWVQVQEILANEKDSFKFTYFERKPLGVGTMAQVHRAKILVDGKRQDVVVRFIKPDIAERVQEDGRILAEVAALLDANSEFAKTGAPKLAPIVSDITATVVAELSQKETIQRQQLAQERYAKTVLMKIPQFKNFVEFNVPKIFESKSDSKLMVQEMVLGEKMDKAATRWKDLAPDLKRGLIEALAYHWAEEVMFKKGFYHSDLHQGNFMIQFMDPKIRLHILDFGMGGTISAHLQNQVMLLGAGTELLKPDLIAQAFWKISDQAKNQINQNQFEYLVKQRVLEIQRGQEKNRSVEHWTAWAMDQGLRLPYEFISLNRGLVIVNKLLADSGSSLTVSSLMKDLARKHPFQVYRRMVIQEKLSHQDLVKLGWGELKSLLGLKQDLHPALVSNLGLVRCEGIFFSN